MKEVSLSFPTKEEKISWMRQQLLEEGLFYRDVAKILGVTKQWVCQLCLKYKIDISERTARWYAKNWGLPELEDDTWLKEQKRKGNTGLNSLARQLGVSPLSLARQIERLGLEKEDFFNPRHGRIVVLTCYNCGKEIKRSASRVNSRKHAFCDKSCRSAWLGREFGFGSREKIWGAKEDAFVRARWRTMSDKDMAKKLGFAEGTLKHHRSTLLGLYRKRRRFPQGGKMKEKSKKGRLEVITGCMFSGKTEELIRRVERERIALSARAKLTREKERGGVIVFKPSIDLRYSPEGIVTHYKRGLSAHNLVPGQESMASLEKLVGKAELERATVIAFDEAQFFSWKIVRLCKALVNRGKRVIVAGLDLTFAGQPFGPMPDLMALADEVQKLHAVCVRCGAEATRTQRLINGNPAPANAKVIVVGGTKMYEARCLGCWEVR